MKNHRLRQLLADFGSKQVVLTWAIQMVLLLSLTFSLVACSLQQPLQQPLLLLEHSAQGKSQIYAVHPDGSHLTLIAEFTQSNWYWLSPNGKYLAFLALGEQNTSYDLRILEMASGTIIEELPQVRQTWSEIIPWEENVAWSPQEIKLAFLRSPESRNEPDIFMYDLSTQTVTALTNDKAVERAMSWAPDGEQLAFVTWDGCEQSDCLPEEEYWNVDVMNVDGSNRHRLIAFQDLELLPADLWTASLCNLTWSPDGKQIAFENECRSLSGPPYWKEVFVTSVDGSELKRLTDFTADYDLNASTLPDIAFRYSLQWLPQNSSLLIGYTKIAVTPTGFHYGGFLTVNRDREIRVSLPETRGTIGSTAIWSPSKEYVAWHTEDISESRMTIPKPTLVGRMDIDRVAVIEALTNLPAGSLCSTSKIYWSFDSRFLAYDADQPGFNCFDKERGQEIVVVSIPDGQIFHVAESLTGEVEILGWIPESNEGKP